MRTKNRDSPQGNENVYSITLNSHLQNPHRILSFLSDGKTKGQRLVCDTSTTHSTRILREKVRKIVATFFFSAAIWKSLTNFTNQS